MAASGGEKLQGPLIGGRQTRHGSLGAWSRTRRRSRCAWGDADPAGIAFYPRFFEWYDIGTEALFASLGLTWAEAFPRYGIVGVPILEAGSRFVAPVRYGDAVAVRTHVAWVREKTFRVEHELSVGDRRCAEGFEVRAWIARPEWPGARLRAPLIPPEVAAKLRGQTFTS